VPYCPGFGTASTSLKRRVPMSDTGGAGTDTIVATFHDAAGGLHTSNTVTKIWPSTVTGVPEFNVPAIMIAAVGTLAIALFRRTRLQSVPSRR
jgi:hypothetical protein